MPPEGHPSRFSYPLPTKHVREISSSTFHSNALFQIEMERVKCVWFPFLASFPRCFGNVPSEILTTRESIRNLALTRQLLKIFLLHVGHACLSGYPLLFKYIFQFVMKFHSLIMLESVVTFQIFHFVIYKMTYITVYCSKSNSS